jgi:hypothetical protein
MGNAEPTNSAVIDALNGARKLLVKPGAVNTEFGWSSAADDREFLSAVDSMLEELGIQFAARQIDSAHEIRALRVGAQKYVDTTLASVENSPREHLPTCDHVASEHTVSGCRGKVWVDGTDDYCRCGFVTALPNSQVRRQLADSIARETGDRINGDPVVDGENFV